MSSSDTCVCGEFTAMTVNNKISYTTVAVTEEKESITNFTREIIELFCYKKFFLKSSDLKYFGPPHFCQKLSMLLDFDMVGFTSEQKQSFTLTKCRLNYFVSVF